MLAHTMRWGSMESLDKAVEAIHSAMTKTRGRATETMDKTSGNMTKWMEMEARIEENVKAADNIVTLDVGGTIFKTSKDTLLSVEGSYFHALLGSGLWEPTSTGSYFLDLDPHLFRRVFVYLRTGKLSWNHLSYVELKELNAMMDYLKLSDRGAPTHPLRWNADVRAPGIAVSTDLRTIERLASQVEGWCIADRELTDCLRLRVDAAPGLVAIALGSTAHVDMRTWSPTSQSTCCFLTSGEFYVRGVAIPTTLSKVPASAIVTVRRGLSHVEFAVNNGQPFNVALDDPFEDLCPMVTLKNAGCVLTILD
ncbi:hypothetical protein DYB32_006337 [Aphanomyces invadans]|uniref:BTB domain-containing protein n=1 Tax=Aphanomyces invadans TaxID=157072 RepID=A0A418ATP2_9STRA|nr:hypothetical protein DYB32_006337 [Aphanomyces invadans]